MGRGEYADLLGRTKIMEQEETNDIRFTKIILKRMILRACEDSVSKTQCYKRSNTRNLAKKWKDDAIHFLKSRMFEQLCDAVGWSHSSIRKKAFNIDGDDYEISHIGVTPHCNE
jgi:hypothetical protein